MPEDVHEATDAVDDGFALVRSWEQRGGPWFRGLAFDFFRFGARVYAHYQPQFLEEFIEDNLEPRAVVGELRREPRDGAGSAGSAPADAARKGVRLSLDAVAARHTMRPMRLPGDPRAVSRRHTLRHADPWPWPSRPDARLDDRVGGRAR